MNILIIHDERRTDRAKTLQQELQAQNIKGAIFVPAVISSPHPVKNISDAHKTCVSMAKSLNLRSVIIMEDDVMFTHPDSFQRFLGLVRLLELSSISWNMFLGGVYDGELQLLNEGVAMVTEFSGLHCYAIHERFYDTLLSAPENINLDKWLSGKKYNAATVFMAYPMVALQYDGYSDNVKRKTDYNKLIKDRYEIWKGA